MQRHLFRTLILAAALTALAVPVFSVTQNAAACSQPEGSCTVTIDGSSTFDTFISPLMATIGSTSFGELPTQAQMPGTTSIPGDVNITVQDLRGNNQGFSVYLQCAPICLSASQFPSGIPDSAFSVTGLPVFEDVDLWFGDGTGGEAGLDGGLAGQMYPQTLNNPVLVGGECQWQIIGMSIYNETVPVSVAFPNEELTLPVSWNGNFLLNVVENAPPGGCKSAGEIDDPATGMVEDF